MSDHVRNALCGSPLESQKQNVVGGRALEKWILHFFSKKAEVHFTSGVSSSKQSAIAPTVLGVTPPNVPMDEDSPNLLAPQTAEDELVGTMVWVERTYLAG